MKKRATIGFLGTGNMAIAMAKTLSKNMNVIGYSRSADKAKPFKKFGKLVKSAEDLYQKSDIIVFAVKPQSFSEIPVTNKPVVSVLGGTSIAKLRKVAKNKILRIMPSISVANGKSAILRCGDKIPAFESALKKMGTIFEVEEKQFHELSLIAGSMPALISSYLLAVMGAIESPLSPELKRTLVETAFQGVNIEEDFEEVIRKVKSPGGITEAYLGIQSELNRLVERGLKAAAKRSEELGR